jgi:hypothetical protein
MSPAVLANLAVITQQQDAPGAGQVGQVDGLIATGEASAQFLRIAGQALIAAVAQDVDARVVNFVARGEDAALLPREGPEFGFIFMPPPPAGVGEIVDV